MGNKITKQSESFGSISSKEGCKHRPGYYYNKTKLIYDCNEILLLPGEADFKKLKFGYFKTNMRVFYKGHPIQANPKTFVLLNRKNVKDHDKELQKLDSVIGIDFVDQNKRFFYKGSLIKRTIN